MCWIQSCSWKELVTMLFLNNRIPPYSRTLTPFSVFRLLGKYKTVKCQWVENWIHLVENLNYKFTATPEITNIIIYIPTDACLYKLGPRPGIIILFDMKHVRLSHLTRVRISSIKKFFQYLQEGLPARLCQIHIFNVVSFFGTILAMIKPFMRAEIFKVVCFCHMILK